VDQERRLEASVLKNMRTAPGLLNEVPGVPVGSCLVVSSIDNLAEAFVVAGTKTDMEFKLIHKQTSLLETTIYNCNNKSKLNVSGIVSSTSQVN
jgi:hypothetical protein